MYLNGFLKKQRESFSLNLTDLPIAFYFDKEQHYCSLQKVDRALANNFYNCKD